MISRRDFLKLSSALSVSSLLGSRLQVLPGAPTSDPNAKNILIIVFDALSAKNINFYGYPRETMPNLTRLLDRATVYHNHYASGNFTTPGTASLLTGHHPWEHLAMKLGDPVSSALESRSVFSLFNQHYRIAYTHNHFADKLLNQFEPDITMHIPRHSLFLQYSQVKSSRWFDTLMTRDPDLAMLFKARLNDSTMDGYLYSLLFPSLLGTDEYQLSREISSQFPRGVPEAAEPFALETAINWTIKQISTIPQPFFGYFHFLPPHSPYNTRIDYFDTFQNDSYVPLRKPRHPVVIQNEFISPQKVEEYRREYDEFLLYVDSEFHRLFTFLDTQEILDNTLLIFTSDHGEIFERKTIEHNQPLLYDPVIKIPLVIFDPEKTERIDVHSLTSCVDLLPTILQYSDYAIPSELPGTILPSFSENFPDNSRSIYALDARWNQDEFQIKTASLMMRRKQLKIIRYSNYANYYKEVGYGYKYDFMQTYQDPFYQVYDLAQDAEELKNLADQPTKEVQALIDELEDYFREHVEFPPKF